MSEFTFYDHVENRFVSARISWALDNTVGEAIRRIGRQLGMQDHTIRTISISVTNAMHAGVDSTISYRGKGLRFESWDLASNFFIKQCQDFLKDHLDDHQEHFHSHTSRASGETSRGVLELMWEAHKGMIASEGIALAKALFMPKPKKRQ